MHGGTDDRCMKLSNRCISGLEPVQRSDDRRNKTLGVIVHDPSLPVVPRNRSHAMAALTVVCTGGCARLAARRERSFYGSSCQEPTAVRRPGLTSVTT